MKTLWVGAFALLASGAAPAMAADIPLKALPPAAEAAFNWSGFYAGLNGGGAWQDRRPDITLSNNFGIQLTTTGLKGSGGFGGVQAGYNWQQGPIVVGIETDFQGSAIKDSFVRLLDPFGDQLAASRDLDYFGTTRVRVGAAFNQFLIYGTVGAAYAHVTNTELVTNINTPGSAANLANSSMKLGVAAGAGIEYAINRSWSVKVEDLWTGIPGEALSAPVLPPSGIIISSSRLTDDFQLLRVGVNYRIGEPAATRY